MRVCPPRRGFPAGSVSLRPHQAATHPRPRRSPCGLAQRRLGSVQAAFQAAYRAQAVNRGMRSRRLRPHRRPSVSRHPHWATPCRRLCLHRATLCRRPGLRRSAPRPSPGMPQRVFRLRPAPSARVATQARAPPCRPPREAHLTAFRRWLEAWPPAQRLFTGLPAPVAQTHTAASQRRLRQHSPSRPCRRSLRRPCPAWLRFACHHRQRPHLARSPEAHP